MKISIKHGAFLIVFAVFLCLMFWGLNMGQLGHDYFYFFPRLLDGKWHFLRQGFNPFVYTPHFCGGMPQFAEPEDMYFSLMQFLSFGMDMWIAVQITFGLIIIIGYFGWYRVGRDLVKLDWMWAHLLSIMIVARGSRFMHAIAGHITFHTTILLGWLLWLLFDPEEKRMNLTVRASIFGLMSAYILYNGGFITALIGIIAYCILLPLDLLLHPKNLRQRTVLLFKRSLACGAAAFLATASKLVAIFSFVRNYPRLLPPEHFPDGVSTLAYIAKAFWAFPQTNDLFWEYGMPNWGAVHEYSLYLSPVSLVGLLLLPVPLWRYRKVILKQKLRSMSLVLYSGLVLLFFVQFTRGHGFMSEWVQQLPIMESMQMPMRYLYPFALLILSISVWVLQDCVRASRLAKWSFPITVSASIVTVAAFIGAYYGLLKSETLPRTMPYDTILTAMAKHPDMVDLTVTEAFDMRGMGRSGFVPMFFGGTEIYCFQSIFLGSSTLPDNIITGPVDMIRDGAFNMRNPACMVYPEENNCQPGDRIAVSDRANLERFIRGEATTWKVSAAQHIANWLNPLALLFCLFTVGRVALQKLRSRS